MSIHRLPAVLSCLALVLAGALTTGSSGAVADPGDPAGKVATSRAEARDALVEARAVLTGRAAPGTDATMALLQLWRLRDALSPGDRAAADLLLARPATTQSACTADNCYHWTTGGTDGVPTTDADADGVPDYVETVMATVDGVHDTYVAAGYRAPKADGLLGGNAKTDIYLEDVGSDSLYGYCTTDMELPPDTTTYDAWAYCVLDNDYSAAQFPTNTPLENLQVTAAHEYFHAVQFGYDSYEDSWLMEATATWAEDELFDDVDDNVQYLVNSPLTKPGQPLDTFITGAGPQYGEWIFFRFLTELLPDAEGGLPTLVRDVWRRADSVNGPAEDEYSIQAVAGALSARGVSLPRAYALFATVNRAPALWYEEGAANHYPSSGPAATVKLTKSKKDSGWRRASLLHLSSITVRFLPGTGLSATAWKLKVNLDLPDTSTGSAAAVTVYKRSGAPQVTIVPLNSSGAATRKVAFGSRGVKYVEVSMINAGTRYSCWTSGDYSCQGSSLDDGRKVLVRATAVK